MDLTSHDWNTLNTSGPVTAVCTRYNANSATGYNFLKSDGTILGVSDTCNDPTDTIAFQGDKLKMRFFLHIDETCSTLS